MKQIIIGACMTVILFVLVAGILAREYEGQGVDSVRGDGVFGVDFLQSPATVLDVVMSRLEVHAASINRDPDASVRGIAGILLTTKYGQPPMMHVDVGITEEGRVRLVGSTGGMRVDPDEFRGREAPEKAACALLLQSLTRDFLGSDRRSVHGEFIPEVSYTRYMGAVRRDVPAFRSAARALWLNTEATFYLYEEEGERMTECQVRAGPDSWVGDTP
jgi:hypothetical protein